MQTAYRRAIEIFSKLKIKKKRRYSILLIQMNDLLRISSIYLRSFITLCYLILLTILDAGFTEYREAPELKKFAHILSISKWQSYCVDSGIVTTN